MLTYSFHTHSHINAHTHTNMYTYHTHTHTNTSNPLGDCALFEPHSLGLRAFFCTTNINKPTGAHIEEVKYSHRITKLTMGLDCKLKLPLLSAECIGTKANKQANSSGKLDCKLT